MPNIFAFTFGLTVGIVFTIAVEVALIFSVFDFFKSLITGKGKGK